MTAAAALGPHKNDKKLNKQNPGVKCLKHLFKTFKRIKNMKIEQI